jgi:hypothetical protein
MAGGSYYDENGNFDPTDPSAPGAGKAWGEMSDEEKKQLYDALMQPPPGTDPNTWNSDNPQYIQQSTYWSDKIAGIVDPASDPGSNFSQTSNWQAAHPGQSGGPTEGAGNPFIEAYNTGKGLVNDYLNSGQNRFQADPYAVDPNAYNYGGYAGGAQDWSDQALAQGQRSQQYEDQYAMQGAEAIQAGRQNMYASEDPLLSGKEEQSRYYQGDSLGLAQQAAYGNAPSVAQNQLTYGIGRTIADQSSAASSARGAAAMAMAQQNAMGNSAQALGDYNNQMAMLRAQEMAAARAAYQQGTEQMRGQDQSRLTQSNQVSQFNAGQGQNEAQLGLGLAQLGLGYGNQAQGYNAQAQNVQGQQLQAQGNQQAQNSQNQQAADGINSGISGANAAAKKAQVDRAISTVATVVGTMAGGPAAGAVAGQGAKAATSGNGGNTNGSGNAGGGIGGTNPNSGTNDPYYGQAGY